MNLTTLSKNEVLVLSAISGACFLIIANTFHDDGEPLIASIAFSGLAFCLTYSLIRWLGEVFMKAGLKGKDMSKIRKVEMWVGYKTSSVISSTLIYRTQSGDYGRYLCRRLSPDSHHLHTLPLLQRHCRGNFGRW